MPIAILGGGGVGKTMAGDCALAGKVRIWDQPALRRLTFAILEKTGIKLGGHQFSYYGLRGTVSDMWNWLPTYGGSCKKEQVYRCCHSGNGS